MNVYIIIASVDELSNIKAFEPMLIEHNCKVVVIDECNKKLRERNDKLLSEVPHVYYGPSEREDWFKQRFGSNYKKYASVIPEKCHAETSFGLLIAYEERPDFLIELDDDVFPVQGHNIIDCHANNLFNDNGVTIYSKGKWYNTIENLELNTKTRIFSRGHPYAQGARTGDYIWDNNGGKCTSNMGLWTGCSDLDALTILYHGGLNGRCCIEGKKHKKGKVIIGKGTYFNMCSMNASFLPEIIPAFYQLYMNFMGIDRFDDIWSGIFLKKVTDHLGHKVCLGKPLVYHDKRPRDIFKDLKREIEGIAINEILWKIVDVLELDGKSYWYSYNSLIDGLEKKAATLQDLKHRKIMLTQIKKMRLWLKVIDKIK